MVLPHTMFYVSPTLHITSVNNFFLPPFYGGIFYLTKNTQKWVAIKIY